MNKIKSGLHSWNNHLFLGLSFCMFALIASAFWGFIYAADPTTVVPSTTGTTPTTTGSTPNSTDTTPLSTDTNPIINTVVIPDTTLITPNTTGTILIPAAPTSLGLYGGVALTSSSKFIPIKWIDNSTNEDKFNIERRVNGGAWAYLSQTTNSYYSDSNVTPGVTYDYRVQACLTNIGCSSFAVFEKAIIPVATVATTPVCTALTLSLADAKTTYTIGDTIKYTWTCIPFSSLTTVFISIQKPDGTSINTNSYSQTGTSTSSFGTSSLVAGTYIMKACLGAACSTTSTVTARQVFTLVSSNSGPSDNSGTSNGTVTTSTIPAAPTNLGLYGGIALTSSSKFIPIKWTDNSTNEDKFNIERRVNGGAWAYLYQTANLVYSDYNVTPGVSYDYRVQACLTNVGCSSFVVFEKAMVPVASTVSTSTTTNTAPPTSTTVLTTTTPSVPDTTVKTTDTDIKIPTAATVSSNATTVVPAEITSPSKLTSTNTTVATSVKTDSNVSSTPVIRDIPAEKDSVVITTSEVSNITEKEIVDTLNILTSSAPETIISQTKTDVASKEEPAELVYKDTNKDGISDYESKYIYNIDPIKSSPVSIYEGKTINASEKLLLGFDPSKTELVKTKKEEPIDSGAAVVATYKVNKIELLKDKKQIIIKGQALPNSFVTVYIYSTPIIVTIKTDSRGEWQYLLDKELENGDHTVYTATVNNTGNIVAQSSPYSFTKTAEAVTLKDIPVTGASVVTDKPGLVDSKNLFLIVIGLIMSVGVIFILIGLFTRKNKEA